MLHMHIPSNTHVLMFDKIILLVTCQLVTLHDGMAYNSTEIVWNAEPKDVVYMFPYVLAFTADTVEIRMALNGTLIQTIAVSDLHLLSKKVKRYSSRFS